MPATVTTDFREEFEAESTRRLRKRFMWYCGVVLALSMLTLVSLALMVIFAPPDVTLEVWIISTASVLAIVPFAWAFFYAKNRQQLGRGSLIQIVFWLIVGTSMINLIITPLTQKVSSAIAADQLAKQSQRDAASSDEPPIEDITLAEAAAENQSSPFAQDAEPTDVIPDDPETPTADGQNGVSGEVVIAERDLPGGAEARVTIQEHQLGIGATWMLNLFITHLFAALFIPWTPREAIKPLIPLLIVNAAGMIGFKLFNDAESWLTVAIVILLSPLVGVPGTLICWWRHSRFRNKFHYAMLRGRYGEIKQELTDARRIHEALFPEPIIDGPVRMDFVYQPMRQIGGDYFFTKHIAREDGSSVLNLILIDVTGHGLTAALTVNRLAGEIQREFGENPDVSPADILRGLNNYIHHTLALHSVYATAKAIKVDTREDTILWASAGHPPAFLRAVDGTIERIESTALVLGACLGDDFVVEQCEHRFGRGDTLLLYTDGATEARNNDGKMMSVRGLEAILANGRPAEHGGWSATVMEHVDSYRSGPADDDTLLVEVYRPLHS